MAAELILTPLINKTVEIAGNLIVEETSRLYWLKTDIAWLQKQLNLMQSYLEDAQQKEAGDHRVTALMKHIEELALDVEDLLDTYLPQLQSPKGKGQCRWLKKGHKSHQLALEIGKIKRRVEEIDLDRKNYGITETDDRGEQNIHEEVSKRSILYAYETEIVGQDKSANELEAKLLDQTTSYGVISIVGMPGLGKTTIAKRIYNRVKDQFDCLAMEYVSQVPKVKEILRSIAKQVGVVEKLRKTQNQLEELKDQQEELKDKKLYLEKMMKKLLKKPRLDTIKELKELKEQIEEVEEQIKEVKKPIEELEKLPKTLEDLKLEDLQYELRSFLQERKYITILDDIWANTAWDELRRIFPSNPKTGSRLIITSRNNNIGRYIGGESSLHELKPLNSKDSITLFWKLVMTRQADTIISPDLEDIGRKIAKKCGGVPLAIVVTAGILRARGRNEREWSLVLKSMGHSKEDECSKILALSYMDLPSKLKPCFLYFGLFPEDYEIPASSLINMWVAERFIQANGGKEVEEVGEDYLYELAARNLVQVVKRGFDGRVEHCRIHDLLHSLCISMAQENNFFQTLDNLESVKSLDPNSVMKVRRITIHLRSIDEFIALNLQMPKLRALLCFAKIRQLEEEHCAIIFEEHKLLRVLRVDFVRTVRPIPNRSRKMRQLCYLEVGGLDADGSHFKRFKNLQSIDMKGLIYVDSDQIWKMEKLRHLRRVCGNFSPPTEVSLPSLQTLDIVHSVWHPKMIMIFNKLPRLRRLTVKGDVDAFTEELSGETPVMPSIEILKLHSYYSKRIRVKLSSYLNLVSLHLRIPLEKLPEAEEFPPNLVKLTQRDSGLRKDPMETLGRLPKLKILKLCEYCYKGKSMNCSGLESFAHLKVLVLRGLDGLAEVMVDDGVLPQLETAVIEDCPALKQIPDRLQDIRKMA